MKPVAYYYANSKYGHFLGEVRYATADHIWTRMAYANESDPAAVWLPKMVAAAKKAVAAGKLLVLALNAQDERDRKSTAIAKVLRAMAPFWRSVLAVELADEPKWTKLVTQREVRKVKLLIQGQGLAARPCFIVYTGKQILMNDAHRAKGLDGVGIEAYLDYIPGETPAQAARRMALHISAQLARVAPSKRIVLVWQAYSRNYTWANIESLVAVQKPIYDAAQRLGDRLICSNLFSYGRPSGTREYPELRAEHKRLFRGA